ncbi:uncharacterized protein DUF2530 [Motilibacter peucedani]|uniref:Uncharacterized protein DUF2530 n=1 Tax=Motilibacter peucedani TaxID=598650 RepID=A0A420XL24_9ACTN|nr:DUF2530 domain-containing protein [Motilibacter peucedani]RKS68537.1 uncharacterized protein DUF2530 [Motilibacter peucedani]
MSDEPEVRPLDVDGVGIVSAGTAVWALALVALLPFTGRLRDAGHGWWIGMCAAGTALGLFGVWYCRRRRASLSRR